MMRYCLILALIATSLNWGCFTEITIPFPPHESKMVLNSVLSSDQTVKAWVTFSVGIGDTIGRQGNTLFDAEVELFENGVSLGLLTFVPETYLTTRNLDTFYIPGGHYLLDYYPKPGFTYTLKASHEDYPPVTGSTRLPQTDPTNTLQVNDLQINQLIDPEGTVVSGLYFQILSEKPTLFLSLQGEIELVDSLQSEIGALYFRSPLNQPKFLSGIRQMFWVYENAVNDQVFFSAEGQEDELPAYKHLIFEYQLCDSFYFNYRLEAERHTRSNFDMPNFLNPGVQVPLISNIEGGYGLVGSYSVIRDTL